ncbi:MAG: hypothetical protein U5J83_07035 [Bryobacterales bacterium]|nr:hypothetical protein [Bryobacterales bacterium]
MKLGAEPRKVVILAVLLVIGAISIWMNYFSNGSGTPANTRPNPPKPAAQTTASGAATASPSATGNSGAAATQPRGNLVRSARGVGADQRLGEFRPVFKSERRGESLDPTKVDPTLRTDLLAKLQEVRMSGPGRNLFQFGQAPPPPRPPEPKIIPAPVAQVPLGADGQPIPVAPVKPPPPAIPLRYFGFVDPKLPADTRAFFMEGEEIRIAAVGEMIKQRYRVLAISPKSAEVEDTQFDNKQTLTIQPESGT